jgi:hypothetical protein
MQAHAFHFRRHVTRSDVVTGSARGTALQQAVGKKADVGADLLRADYFGCSVEGRGIRGILPQKIDWQNEQAEQHS